MLAKANGGGQRKIKKPLPEMKAKEMSQKAGRKGLARPFYTVITQNATPVAKASKIT